MPILEVSNLSVSFSHKLILDRISFTLDAGQYLAVVGPNGAGKSTLIKTLLGDNNRYEGNFSFDKSIGTKGYVAQQNNDYVFFPATVLEVIKSGMVKGLKLPFLSSKQKQKVLEIVNMLKLESLLSRSFYTLSGGQKRAVLLARAFCASSSLLILDEPTAGLDSAAVTRFYENLRTLHENSHTAILMISHDLHNVVEEADSILYLKQKVMFFGSKESFVKHPLYQNFLEQEKC